MSGRESSTECGDTACISAQQFQTIIDRAPFGIYVVDAQLRIRQVNPLARAAWGNIPEVIGRKLDDVVRIIFNENHAGEILRLFRHTLETGASYATPSVTKLRADRGLIEHYEWRIDRMLLSDGDGVVCYFRDISTEVEVRQAVIAAEEELRLLADAAPVYLAHCDKDQRYVFVNRAYATRLGLDPSQVIGKSIPEVLGQAAYATVEPYVQVALSGQPVSFDVDVPYEKLGRRFMHVSYVPEQDAQTNVHGFVAAITDITEQRQLLEAVRTNEQRLRLVTENAKVGLVAVGPDHRYRFANQAYADILGLPTHDLVGKRVEDVLSTVYEHQIRPRLDLAFSGGMPVTYELAVPGIGGKGERRYAVTYEPITATADADAVVVVVIFEITERVQAEHALRESEERLRLATENAEIGFWDVDVVHDVLIWPARVKAMFGISPDVPVTMQDFYHGLHPDDRAATAQAYASASDPGKRALYDVEYRTIGKEDGIVRWVAAKGRGVFDHSGRCVRVIGTAIDITRRKATEAALTESEERFRTLADNMSQFAWMTDETGWIFWYNQQWYDYTGTTLETMKGWGWQHVHHPEYVAGVTERFKRSIEAGEPWEDIFPLRGKRGEWRWFLSRARPIRDQAGKIVRWFGTNTDITQQRETEAALRRANSDLEQFAYSASHDLKEPLRNVLIYSELLARRCGPTVDGHTAQFLSYITEGASRMESLIAGLLAYTEIRGSDAGASELISTDEVLQEVTGIFRELIEKSGATVSFDPLPAVRMREVHLIQLLQNLIGNALKYHGEDAPRIRIRAEDRGEHWLFSVADNGIGIHEDYKESVFGIFKRLHTRARYAGTGIGLAICQRIVERYGGRIWVESELGKGSTFLFTVAK